MRTVTLLLLSLLAAVPAIAAPPTLRPVSYVTTLGQQGCGHVVYTATDSAVQLDSAKRKLFFLGSVRDPIAMTIAGTTKTVPVMYTADGALLRDTSIIAALTASQPITITIPKSAGNPPVTVSFPADPKLNCK